MAAFGGKSENGAVKEKSDRNGDLRGCVTGEIAGVPGARTALIARQKRKREAAKKRDSIAIRGGRIATGVSSLRCRVESYSVLFTETVVLLFSRQM